MTLILDSWKKPSTTGGEFFYRFYALPKISEWIWEPQFSNKNCLHCINSNGKKPSQFLQFRTFRTVTLVSKFWQPTWYFRSGAYNTKCNRAKQFLREHLFISSEGQLISKANFKVFHLNQKINKNIFVLLL